MWSSMRVKLAERLGEHHAVRRASGLVTSAAGVGQAGVDAAPVLGAHAAGDEAVGLEAADHARERALAEVDRRGELLHAALGLLALGEPLEHLVLADAEAVVILQPPLEGADGARVAVEQVAPGVDDVGLGHLS